MVEQLRGNVARKGAPHGQADVGVEATVTHQGGQQGVDGAFVDAQGELAAAAGTEVVEGALGLLAKIEHALGIVDEQLAGVGELAAAGAAGEERLAHPVFEAANGDADGGLGAEELLGGAGEAALASDGEEDVEFSEVHGVLPSEHYKPQL